MFQNTNQSLIISTTPEVPLGSGFPLRLLFQLHPPQPQPPVQAQTQRDVGSGPGDAAHGGEMRGLSADSGPQGAMVGPPFYIALPWENVD